MGALLVDGYEHVCLLARQMAYRHDLPADWLNSNLMDLPGFPVDHEPKRAATVYDSPNLVVTGASVNHLIAMKAYAGRRQDLEDLRYLLPRSDIRDWQGLEELHRSVFPQHEIPSARCERLKVLLEEVFPKAHMRERDDEDRS